MGKQIAMIGVGGTPSTRLSSHNAGWTFALADLIKNKFGSNSIIDIIPQRVAAHIHEFDVILLNEGVNFKGKFNFFGGMGPDNLNVLHELSNFKGEIYTYNEIINWKLLLKRSEIRHHDESIYCVNNLPSVKTIHTNTCSSSLIIGDSHSLSIFKPGSCINRIDGKTLHGFLKDPMKYIGNTDDLTDITMYFGNIDIRFHIFRQDDPKAAINKLAKNYTELCDNLMILGLNVIVQGLLPIEDESRKLPGTGLYLGERFFGSQADRQGMVDYFNQVMYNNSQLFGFDFDGPWLPSPLSFDMMEARQSVHIRPKFYKHANEIQFLLSPSETSPSLFS